MTGRSKFWGTIGLLGSLAGAISIFSFVPSCHSNYVDASNKATILWNAADSIDHFMKDVHVLLGDVENRQAIQDQLDKAETKIDSLELILDITLEGKYPYNDTVLVWDRQDNRYELQHITEVSR